MADVRLTATNPEDSTVVPVACNAKGELKLEEIPDQSFDGNLDGDLTVTGSASFGGEITNSSFVAATTGSAAFSRADANKAVSLLSGSKSYVLNKAAFIQGFGTDNNLSYFAIDYDGDTWLGNDGFSNPRIRLNGRDGRAVFVGDVIVGSRNKKWMIVESNGLAHLVEQSRAADVETADLVNPSGETFYPPLRDIPGELTMVEQQLQKVLEKLRMIPEAGWEVWDGSD